MDHEPSVRIFLRPIGSGLPLGFFAFAIGMLMLAATPLGWAPQSDQHTIGLILAAFVFPLELVATIVAFLARDTFGATGVGLFTTSWLALGLGLALSPPGSRSNAVGLFLFAFAAAAGLLAAAALLGKPLFTLLIGLGATRAALSGVWEIWGSTRVEQVGGVIAVILCVLGLYGGIALLLEDAQQRAVLPLGRIGDARRALEGDLSDQVRRVSREAGVREQL
jgi:hypothetical protein